MSGAASLPGAEFFSPDNRVFFLKKPLVPGSFAARGRTFSKKTEFQEFWDSCAQNKTSEISKIALSGILGLLGAEQNVRNLKTCTFRNSGTPGRRTKRQKSQKMHFQEFWDSCAQNKTSEISKSELSGFQGLLCAEQEVGNLKKWTFRNSGAPVRRTRRRGSQKDDVQEFWDSCA